MKITQSVLLGIALAGSLAGASLAADQPTSMTVNLTSQNGSGENGTATITQTPDGGITVVTDITGAPADVPQPIHIHEGTCAKLNPAPEYPLHNMVNGKSTTTVKNVTIADLLKTPHAINVHKSGTDIGTYVSCGDITTK